MEGFKRSKTKRNTNGTAGRLVISSLQAIVPVCVVCGANNKRRGIGTHSGAIVKKKFSNRLNMA